MIVAFDTSVLLPALTPALPAHAEAHAWIRAAVEGRVRGVMSWHAFAEAWSVLTRLPIKPVPTPAAARDALASVHTAIRPRALDARDYELAVARCVERGLRSGAIFDALHVIAAERAGADIIVTADVQDFERLVLPGGLRVVSRETPPQGAARRGRH